MPEKREVVERRDGVTVSIELKRGTGTRDQDKLSGTVHADDMAEADRKAAILRQVLEAEASKVRAIQPEADDGNGDGA